MKDFADLIKTHELNTKMFLYGRNIIEVDGRDVVTTNVICDYELTEIVDFKALDKGCETYIKGEEYPLRFCFQEDKFNTLTQVKRLIPVMFRTLSKSKLISALYFYNNWQEYISFIHHMMRDVFAKVNYYNQPTRELYKVLSDEGIDNIRDILCAIIEYDKAYRFRFQDIFCEINKEQFEKQTIKEIKRIIKIYNSRELEGFLNRKIGKSLPLLLIYLRLNRKLLNKLRRIMSKLDLNELKPTKEDIYWQNNTVYHYKFKHNEIS